MAIKAFIASVVVGLLFGPVEAQPTQKPQTIIKEMVAKYAGISSYQDTGVVTILGSEPRVALNVPNKSFHHVSFNEGALVSFNTYFARPRMFRFEWSGQYVPLSRQAVIWTEGKKVYSWMPRPRSKDGSFSLYDGCSLKFCIDQARGSSASAIFLIPSMLTSEVGNYSFSDILEYATRLKLTKEESVDGAMCFVIEAILSGTSWTLWIDKSDHILRKIRTQYTSGSFHDGMQRQAGETIFLAEIHRDIKINQVIPRNVFKHKPKLLDNDIDLTR